MTLYPDSSFVVACRVPHDTWHEVAIGFFEKHQEESWLWSPWHRVEVFNTLRQLPRHPDAKRSMSEAEAKALIHRLENDVRCGYFLHLEADWRDVLRTASEISVANAFARACPGTDLLHVAYAVELAAEAFVSFDDEQLELAGAAGLRAMRPSTRYR
jgi:predicted nucleic acid-binding protein